MNNVDAFLNSPDGRAYLEEHYVEKEYSTYKISELLGTYPNKVLRAIHSHRIPVRSRSKAQANAIKKGRATHPTEGAGHSQTTKNRIGESVAKNWEGLSEEEREERCRIAAERWDNLTDQQKETLRERAHHGMSRAAREGSRIEHMLLTSLQAAGYNARHHHETLLGNEAMHIDIWIPELRLAIEVDGPTHFLPIFGEDRLMKTQQADAEKTGLLLSYGYRLLRVKYMLKTLSDYRERMVVQEILGILQVIKESSSENYFEVEVRTDGQKADDEKEGGGKDD